MRSVALMLAFIMALAIPNDSYGFAINVEAESSLGDHFWTIEKLRERRYAKLRQGIHERITVEALNAAERRRAFSDQYPKLRKQVIYGLLFNDDPSGYLFPKTKGNPKGYRFTKDSGGSVVNGIKWMERFGRVVVKMKHLAILKKEEHSKRRFIGWILRSRGKRMRPKIEKELQKDILWASHFGDLQYLHAMGMKHESRAQILAKMRAYSYHAWSVAIGATTFSCFKAEIKRVKNSKQLEIDSISTGTNGECPKPVAGSLARRRELMKRFDETDALYHTDDAEEFKYRALGSILHMIQDSYAKGHTVRAGWDQQNNGKILYFQNYADQDGRRHGAFDSHKSQDINQWYQIPGAKRAMDRSSKLINYFTLQCGWEVDSNQNRPGCPVNGVGEYLFGDVFALEPLSVAEMATRSHENVRMVEEPPR